MATESLRTRALLCAGLFAACDGELPPPPTPIPNELRTHAPSPPGPPTPAPAVAPKPLAPREVPLVVSLASDDVQLGVVGTMESATVWSSKSATGVEPNPTAGIGTLDAAALASLWDKLERAGWRGAGAVGPGTSTFSVAHGGEARVVELAVGSETSPLTLVRRALEAVATKLEPVSGSTQLVLPPRPPVAGDAPAAECAVDGDVVCRVGNAARVCFPTQSPQVLTCLSEPFAQTGTLVHSQQPVVLPLHFDTAWAAELSKGVTCRSAPEDIAVLACSDGQQLTGVLAGKSLWLAHRTTGRPQKGVPAPWGPPVALTRVFPGSGQLAPGARPGPVSAFEMTLAAGAGHAGLGDRAGISGDLRKAKGWLYTSSRNEAPELHRGVLSAAQVKALWAKLNALHWSDRGSAFTLSPEPTGSKLVIAAGGVTLGLSSTGCTACPTVSAIDAVRAAVEALPPVKWKTRVVVPAVPVALPFPAPAVCSGDTCLKVGDKRPRRCLVTPTPGVFYCLSSPWDAKGVSLKADKGDVRPRPPGEVWALELDSGAKCELDEQHTLACKDGARVAELSQAADAWFALVRSKDGSTAPHTVKTAWLISARDPPK